MSKKKIILLSILFLLALAMPSYASTYTPNSETSCIGNICKAKIYGGTQFVQEKSEWVSIDKASSLKDYFNFIYKEKDENLNIEVIDFNYTSITLSLSIDIKEANKDIPLKVYKEGLINVTIKENIRTNTTLNFKDIENFKTVTLPYIFGYDVKFGSNSTVITLNNSNNGTLADTHVAQHATTTNYGTDANIIFREKNSTGIADWILVRVNTSTPPIPVGSTIINATFSMWLDTLENGACSSGSTWIGWVNTSNNSWVETTVTWNSGKPLRDMWLVSTNISVPSASKQSYLTWNISEFYRDSFSGSNPSLSLYMYGKVEADNCDALLESRENTSYAPYVIVWYESSLPTTTTLWLNGASSNTTFNYGSSLNITAQTNVSGLYVASYKNASLMNNATTKVENNTVFGSGVYAFNATTTGNATHGSSNSSTYYATINKLNSFCWLETHWEGTNLTYAIYPNRINMSCKCNSSEAGYNLYRDGVNVNSTENSQFKLLGVATYAYICNTSLTENYTSATNSTNVGVIQGNASNYTNITFNTSSSVSNGTSVNVTCSKPSELTAYMYNNTSSVSNPYSFNATTVGVINFVCNTTSNANYTAGSTSKLLEVVPTYIKRIMLIDEDTGGDFTKFVNMTMLKAVTEQGKELHDFLANNTTSFYYNVNTTDSLMIQKQYKDDTTPMYVDIVTNITNETDIRICVAGPQQLYEIILYSSSIRPVIVKNNYADCYVEAGYTRFAYSNAFMTKIYTKQDLYYVYLFNDSVQYLLTRLDGSSALAIALDVLEFNQKQTTLSLIPEDLTIQRMSNETLKIYYRNEKEDSNQTTMNIYEGASLLYAYIENVTPNDFSLTFNFTAYGAGVNSTLKVDAVILRNDGTTDTISRVFLTNGSYGILNSSVAIVIAFFFLFFGLTMVAVRYALGFFGIIIQGAALAVTTFAPVDNFIRLTQVIIVITLVYTILTYKEENIHIT